MYGRVQVDYVKRMHSFEVENMAQQNDKWIISAYLWKCHNLNEVMKLQQSGFRKWDGCHVCCFDTFVIRFCTNCHSKWAGSVRFENAKNRKSYFNMRQHVSVDYPWHSPMICVIRGFHTEFDWDMEFWNTLFSAWQSNNQQRSLALVQQTTLAPCSYDWNLCLFLFAK